MYRIFDLNLPTRMGLRDNREAIRSLLFSERLPTAAVGFTVCVDSVISLCQLCPGRYYYLQCNEMNH